MDIMVMAILCTSIILIFTRQFNIKNCVISILSCLLFLSYGVYFTEHEDIESYDYVNYKEVSEDFVDGFLHVTYSAECIKIQLNIKDSVVFPGINAYNYIVKMKNNDYEFVPAYECMRAGIQFNKNMIGYSK